MTYQKAITDAATGQTVIVDLTPEEMAEIETKLAANQARAAEEAQAALAVTEAVDALPSGDDIGSAKSIAELKEYVRAQSAVIALLAERLGLKG